MLHCLFGFFFGTGSLKENHGKFILLSVYMLADVVANRSQTHFIFQIEMIR
jgi:hypothetical protein